MDLIRLFSHSSDMETYTAGSSIFQAGDPAERMYVVIAGEVAIVEAGGRVLERAGPGTIIGEMALIGDHRRSATATAATDCQLAPISERRFLFLVQETPFFALHVMKVLAGRLRRNEP